MPDRVEHEKRALRAELRERRQVLSAAQHEQAAEAIAARLEALVAEHGASAISCYLSSPTEPGTRPFINAAMARGLRVLLPITREDGLLDWTAATPEGGEALSPYGVPEAVGEVLGPIAVNDVDLLIIPAAAVDHEGWRLGWGRGYYDKMLGSMERCPPVYAVIYDAELVERVPREIHDQPVTGVVTPTRTLEFPRERR